MDVDVVERSRMAGEESIPDWREMEVGVCEEKEGDFELRLWAPGGKMRGRSRGGAAE